MLGQRVVWIGVGAATLWLAVRVAALAVHARGMGPVLPTGMVPVFMAAFILVFTPILLPLAQLAGPLPSWRRLVAAGGATFLVAVMFEIGVDEAFLRLTGALAWQYRVAPVLGGSTSLVGVVMWPLYGAFVVAVQDGLRRRQIAESRFSRAAILAGEAMFLEVAANLFALLGFHGWFFYYLPGDLNHFTTFAVALPYFVAGLVGVTILDQLERVARPVWIGAGCWGVAAIVVGVAAAG